MGLGFRVWCIHCKHWECACSQAHPYALTEEQTRREAGAQSLKGLLSMGGRPGCREIGGATKRRSQREGWIRMQPHIRMGRGGNCMRLMVLTVMGLIAGLGLAAAIVSVPVMAEKGPLRATLVAHLGGGQGGGAGRRRPRRPWVALWSRCLKSSCVEGSKQRYRELLLESHHQPGDERGGGADSGEPPRASGTPLTDTTPTTTTTGPTTGTTTTTTRYNHGYYAPPRVLRVQPPAQLLPPRARRVRKQGRPLPPPAIPHWRRLLLLSRAPRWGRPAPPSPPPPRRLAHRRLAHRRLLSSSTPAAAWRCLGH